jgi:hemerythrin superfamily protein
MATGKAKSAKVEDAIALLEADHEQVRKLFAQFKELKEEGSLKEKESLVQQVCNALVVHTQIEEEIFYPAVREAIDDGDLMDEALVEHAGAKDLIEQLQGMDPDDDLYDAKVTVLGEQIDHHVEEEEGEMFPKAKKAKLDTVALGEKMLKKKLSLLEEMGVSEDDVDAGEDEDEEDEDSEASQDRPRKSAASKR